VLSVVRFPTCPTKLVSVVEASVVDPVTASVEVEMIDPAINLPLAVVEARFVVLVDVSEPTVEVRATSLLLNTFVVVALVIVALVKIADSIVIVLAKRFDNTFRLVMEEVAAKIAPAEAVAVFKFARVVEPRVDEPEIVRFVPAILTLAVRLVTVVEASVEEPEAIKFTTLEVDALVVEAFKVVKLAVVPHKVVIVARVELRVLIIAVTIFP
jgi:hypothetical protein